MNKSKGFTIIELLVVVAIIAVLAAIVLFNVTKYITQGKIASGKANMAGLQIDGAVYYDGQGNYNGFCAAYMASGKPRYAALINAGWDLTTLTVCQCNTGGAGCTSVSSSWCAIGIETGSTTRFCVDSVGNKVEGATVTCPASGVCI